MLDNYGSPIYNIFYGIVKSICIAHPERKKSCCQTQQISTTPNKRISPKSYDGKEFNIEPVPNIFDESYT